MRVYMIDPAHDLATIDVTRGLYNGFKAHGCEVERYDMNGRAGWLGQLLVLDPRIREDQITEFALAMAGEEIPAKILRYEPDLIVVVNGQTLHGLAWRTIPKMGIPVHTVLTECPYNDDELEVILEHSTQVYANDKGSAERLGIHYLPAAYDPIHHKPPESPIGGCPDVLFIGTGWPERRDFFLQCDWDGLWFQIVGPNWKAAMGTDLERHIEPASIPGKALWPYYAGSGAVVNFHRRSADLDDTRPVPMGWSLNPRCYQVPACGGLLLSDWRPEWDRVLGDALPTFRTPAELMKLCRYYQGHPEARAEAIEASMEAIKPHTYTARAERILEEVT